MTITHGKSERVTGVCQSSNSPWYHKYQDKELHVWWECKYKHKQKNLICDSYKWSKNKTWK